MDQVIGCKCISLGFNILGKKRCLQSIIPGTNSRRRIRELGRNINSSPGSHRLAESCGMRGESMVILHPYNPELEESRVEQDRILSN